MANKGKNNFDKVKMDIQRKKELAEKRAEEYFRNSSQQDCSELEASSPELHIQAVCERSYSDNEVPVKPSPQILELKKNEINEVNTNQFISFWLNDTEYAIEVKFVKEIVRYSSIINIPRSKEFLEGIINLRDNIIPVVNLGYFLGNDEFCATDSSRIIVITINQDLYGILVNKVSQVLRIPVFQINNCSDAIHKENRSLLKGIANLENGKRILILLNISEFEFVQVEKTLKL